jgi:hypothetical protein
MNNRLDSDLHRSVQCCNDDVQLRVIKNYKLQKPRAQVTKINIKNSG